MPCYIIGIGGVTCGGKTSLTERLKTEFKNVHTISLDDYYWPEGSPNHVFLTEFSYENWDIPSSIDFDSLLSSVHEWKEKHETSDAQHMLIIEGFLIYDSSALLPLFDKKYFISITEDQCWSRRRERTYIPPEPEGYFQKVAWPCYLEHKERVSTVKDLTLIDGSRSLDDMYETIQRDIQPFLVAK